MVQKIENGVEEGFGPILSRYPDAHILIRMTSYNTGIPVCVGDSDDELYRVGDSIDGDTIVTTGSNLWPAL